MAVEGIALIASILCSVCTAYGAYKTSDKPTSRWLAITTCIFGIVGLLSAFELSYRTSNAQQQKEELDRSWTLIQSLPVQSIEFEVLVTNGAVNTEELRNFASGIEFELQRSPFPSQPTITTGAAQTALFSIENMRKSGFVGLLSATVRTDEKSTDDAPSAAKIVDSNCILSDSQARKDGDSSPFLRLLKPGGIACAVRADLDVAQDRATLGEILASPQITTTISRDIPERCFGQCDNLLVSIRAVMPSIDGLVPFMLEISPSAYLVGPTNLTSGVATFKLPGETLKELAKSHFFQSQAFRDRDSFQYTQGALYAFYMWATMHTQTLIVVDVIWTTYGPAEESIKGLMPTPRPESVALMELPEWCGFGRDTQCWRRFGVFRSEEDEN